MEDRRARTQKALGADSRCSSCPGPTKKRASARRGTSVRKKIPEREKVGALAYE